MHSDDWINAGKDRVEIHDWSAILTRIWRYEWKAKEKVTTVVILHSHETVGYKTLNGA
jgi:hypothetical protein